MVQTRKRKGTAKLRGKRTFGYGSHKKHRGKGSKGGKGMGGALDQKKTWILKYMPDHLGKHGFKSLQKRNMKPVAKFVNVCDIERLVAGGREIDLAKIGISKVLGGGSIGAAVTVRAAYFTESAKRKIEAANGKAVLAGGQDDGTSGA